MIFATGNLSTRLGGITVTGKFVKKTCMLHSIISFWNNNKTEVRKSGGTFEAEMQMCQDLGL